MLDDLRKARRTMREANVDSSEVRDLSSTLLIRDQAITRRPSAEEQRFLLELVQGCDEYLDFALHAANDSPESWPIVAIGRQLSCAARRLLTVLQPSSHQRLVVDGCLLEATVSILISCEADLAVPVSERAAVETAAWRLMHDANEHASATPEQRRWAVIVAADALDLCLRQEGTRILKKGRRLGHRKRWPAPALTRALKNQPDGKPLSVEDLERCLANIALERHDAVGDVGLPKTSATAPDRYKVGRGLVALHWRRSHWDYSRLAFVVMSIIVPIPVLLLIYRLRDIGFADPLKPMRIGPLNSDLNPSDVLNLTLQLLATAGTLAVALAISDRIVPDDQAGQARRWWMIGSIVVMLCAWISMTSVWLLFAAHPNGPYATMILAFVASVLTSLLWAGIGGIQEDRELEIARQRHAAAGLRVVISRAEEQEAVTLTNSEGFVRSIIGVTTFCTVPGFSVGVGVLILKLYRRVYAPNDLLLPLLGASLEAFLTVPAAVVAYKILRGRYERVGQRVIRRLELAGWSLFLLAFWGATVLTFMEQWPPAISSAQVAVYGILAAAVLIPTLMLLASPISPVLRPRSLRRMAYLSAKRQLEEVERAANG